MLYSKYKRFVYLAPPKTGSRSIYNILQEQYSCHMIKDHMVVIPDEFKEYYTFITIRNPYDRAISIWYYVMNGMDEYKYPKSFDVLKAGIPSKNISDFFKFLIKNKEEFGDNPFFKLQSEYINANRIDKFLSVENLNDDFNTLPFLHNREEIKWLNPTIDVSEIINVPRDKNIWKYMNQECLELINEYYGDDFEILSQYKKIMTI